MNRRRNIGWSHFFVFCFFSPSQKEFKWYYLWWKNGPQRAQLCDVVVPLDFVALMNDLCCRDRSLVTICCATNLGIFLKVNWVDDGFICFDTRMKTKKKNWIKLFQTDFFFRRFPPTSFPPLPHTPIRFDFGVPVSFGNKTPSMSRHVNPLSKTIEMSFWFDSKGKRQPVTST